MRKTIPGWVHRPGLHCASTAISDLMTFMGLEISEAMCFGIGCGLGFAYFASDFMNPTRMTATRSRMLEPRFFENMGVPFDWAVDRDPEHALRAARESIDQGRPLLLRADLKFLRYYNSSTSFPPHVIGMWGYDDEKKAALIADTGWEELQEVSYDDLTSARYSGTAFIKNQAEHYAAEPFDKPDDLRPIVNRALVQQARDLLGLKIDIPGLFGFAGMKKAEEAMPGWGEAKDWQWCARWFYQVIEKRGTGGGAFRLLYSLFLDELEGLDPSYSEFAPAGTMKKIARAWTGLSEELKDISDSNAPSRLAKAAAMLSRVRRDEENFFKGVLERLD